MSFFSTLGDLIKNVAPSIASALGSPLATAALSFLGQKILGNATSSAVDVIKAIKSTPEIDATLRSLDLEFAKLTSAELQAYLQLETEVVKGQLAINQAAATNGSFFDRGWRPLAGWASVILSFSIPMIVFIWQGLSNIYGFAPPPDMREYSDMMTTIMFGMLGLGSMRTAEYIKGVISKSR